MPRLRVARVVLNICPAGGCERRYEGKTCWNHECRTPYDSATTRRILQERLILVNVDPPPYVRKECLKCRSCANLYELEEQMRLAARCAKCDLVLLSRERFATDVPNGRLSLLEHARRLDEARKALVACPHCSNAVDSFCWCPLCRTRSHESILDDLPQRPVFGWERTFMLGISLEEAREKELSGEVQQEGLAAKWEEAEARQEHGLNGREEDE